MDYTDLDATQELRPQSARNRLKLNTAASNIIDCLTPKGPRGSLNSQKCEEVL